MFIDIEEILYYLFFINFNICLCLTISTSISVPLHFLIYLSARFSMLTIKDHV